MRKVDEKKNWVFRFVFACEQTTEKLKQLEEDIGFKQKFLIDPTEQQKASGDLGAKVDKSKWAKEGRFYLNIFQHEE